MTDDQLDEDVLRRGLAPLLDAPPPPLSSIRARAATPRGRKHWRGAWIAAGVSVTALALAAAGQVHFFGYDGGLEEVPVCGPVEDMGTAFETLSIEPGDLPDEFRLGWSGSEFPKPQWALARREEHPCASPAALRLVDVEGRLVLRSIDVFAASASGDGGSLEDGVNFQALRNGGIDGWRTSWTPGDGYRYEVTSFGLERADVQALLQALHTKDGQPTVAGWSAADEFEIVEYTEVPADGTRYSWMVSSNAFDSDADPLADLDVHEDPDPLLMHAYAGDRVIHLKGGNAIQSPDGTVTWSPSEGIIATLNGSASDGELRALAQSVTPMPSSEFDLISIG